MTCKAYQPDGTCLHFLNERCPVHKSVREMFGEIEMCKPVRTAKEGKSDND